MYLAKNLKQLISKHLWYANGFEDSRYVDGLDNFDLGNNHVLGRLNTIYAAWKKKNNYQFD